MDSTSIHIDGVTLQRGHVTVFETLSMHLKESRIGLIGDNGAGKSSLFRMICGLDRPLRGSVSVDTPFQARPVGMMFQSPDDQIVFPTVEEELALGLRAQGLTRSEALQQARAFLGSCDLASWATRAVASLSQGQRQHVCWMALRLAGHPVLLLDEPYASLDLPSQSRLRKEIDAAGRAVQVIVSTHALEHVHDYDRVIWLDRGRVRADGPGPATCEQYRADVAGRLSHAVARSSGSVRR